MRVLIVDGRRDAKRALYVRLFPSATIVFAGTLTEAGWALEDDFDCVILHDHERYQNLPATLGSVRAFVEMINGIVPKIVILAVVDRTTGLEWTRLFPCVAVTTMKRFAKTPERFLK